MLQQNMLKLQQIVKLQTKRKTYNIAKFPNFTKFSLNIETSYNKFLKNLEPYADYSFANLAIWLNCNADLELSSLNKNIVLRFSNILEDNQPKTYTIIGTNKIDKSIELLHSNLLKKEDVNVLYAVPEETAKKITKFHTDEDRDNFDYILSVDEQIHLFGTKFGKYRRKVNGFIKESGDETKIKELDLKNELDFYSLVNAMHTWDRIYDVGGNDVERIEAKAITNTLKYHERLGFRCIAILVNNQIEAFSLFRVNKLQSIVNINHTKCSYKYKHLFDFTVYATASKLKTEGIEYINFEQDLGIPGLREHKSGLRPIKFLKKYTVYLDETIKS